MKCHSSFDFFFQPFKSVKSLWAVQKWIVDWIWPAGHSLPTPALHQATSQAPNSLRSSPPRQMECM